MPESQLAVESRSLELRKDGTVVGVTDHVYPVEGRTVTFDEIVVMGDLMGDLEYNGRKLRIVRLDSTIGLIVDHRGARGPLWKGVECEVLS